MKIPYLELAKYSLETSIEHLRVDTDRDLIAGVVLGHHAIVCFMKAAAQALGVTIIRNTGFSSVLGMLNKEGVFRKGETKALELLNKVRNDIEHDEPEFVREEFEVALTDCMHIVERLAGEILKVDIQEEITNGAWEYLIEIGKYADERRGRLEDILSDALGVYGKRVLEVDHEFVACGSCGEMGLLWQGQQEADIKCKFCGQTETLRRCLVCQSVIHPWDDTVWQGEVHQECFDRWGE